MVASETRNGSREDRRLQGDGDSNAQDSRRRAIKAITELQRDIEAKLGEPEAYGQTVVRVRWQGGEITSVSVTSESEHK